MSMIYSYSELSKKIGDYRQVKKAINGGEYFKVARGYYSDQDTKLNELESIFATHPNAVLTLESAFSFYDLSDYIPDRKSVV